MRLCKPLEPFLKSGMTRQGIEPYLTAAAAFDETPVPLSDMRTPERRIRFTLVVIFGCSKARAYTCFQFLNLLTVIHLSS